jgi:hypothetical protein
MEELLKSAEPAIICASERLIELVDRVLNRSYSTRSKNHAAETSAARIRQSCVDYDGRRAS